MLRVFFPGQDVPAWLEKVEISKGKESLPDAKLPDIKFGTVCFVFKRRGYFVVWAPLWFGGCAIRVTNGAHVTITGGGRGVRIYRRLFEVLRDIK